MILASASTARRRMLEDAGVAVRVEPARVDETAIKEAMLAEDIPPRDIADALAEVKAARISGRYPEELVLGADQVLVCDGEIFNKAGSAGEARDKLRTLRAKRHDLISAAVICERGEPVWRHVGTARLTMRPFSDAFLDHYLSGAGDAVTSSVGCYHLEGMGAQLFSRIEGDYFTILGLPLLEILGYLRARGVLTE